MITPDYYVQAETPNSYIVKYDHSVKTSDFIFLMAEEHCQKFGKVPKLNNVSAGGLFAYTINAYECRQS